MSGGGQGPAWGNRYAVLHHTGVPAPHYDLMFETAPDAPLATWRSGRWPIDRPTPLVRLSDHRRHYLDYEGDVGGGRGHVRRVAGGLCRIEIAGAWLVRLEPPLGAIVLRQTESDRWIATPAGEPTGDTHQTASL